MCREKQGREIQLTKFENPNEPVVGSHWGSPDFRKWCELEAAANKLNAYVKSTRYGRVALVRIIA